MKECATRLVCGLLLMGWFGVWAAQVDLLTPVEIPRVFTSTERSIAVSFQNHSDTVTEASLRLRLWQTSSEIAVNLSDTPWKTLKLLPGQTILDVVQISFPPVKAETRFLIQWIEGASNVVGKTEVLVYPTNLLARLKTLAGEDPVGVFDPGNQLKPVLRSLAIEFQDLIEDGTDKFHGKLAIFGPFETKSQMRVSLKNEIRALAKRGVAVVWLLPPPEKRALIKPSFYVVREAAGTVVVAAHGMVAQLAERPEAQLNLLRLAEETLHPMPLDLPVTETSNGN